MTEFLKTNINVGDMLKIFVGFLIPAVIFSMKMEARISILELKVQRIEQKINRFDTRQEMLYKQNQEILADLKYIKYVLNKKD